MDGKEFFSEKKNRKVLFFVLLAFSVVLEVNAVVFSSPLIGAIASIGFLSSISFAIGEIFHSGENLFFKCLLGLATFLLFLAVTGFGLMLIGMFTEILSLAILIAMSVLFGAIAFRRNEGRFQNPDKSPLGSKGIKGKHLFSYLAVVVFLFYEGIAFYFLLLARTGEGGASVWLEISPLFIPAFAICSFILAFILVFSRLSSSLKLVLLIAYAFLAHSLFLIVWYPSRYGDPLEHLGIARYTARTGTIYAYGWLTSHQLIVPLISYRAQYSLVIFFQRMFSIDIYWAHSVFLPLLWSIFVPTLAYKTAELMAVKRSRVFPLLAALSIGLFSSLILWGTVSVPNSLGFIFFFLTAVFLLIWMIQGGKWNWGLALLAASVSFLTHPQPGVFALILVLWGTIIQKSWRRILKLAILVPTFALYPAALYLYGASFSTSGLLVLENFLTFQTDVTTILLGLAFVGLVLGARGGYIKTKIALMLFAFYVAILFEYYLTKFGMMNLPYGAARILVMGDFLLVPFVALGLLITVDILRKVVTKSKGNVSSNPSLKKVRLNFNSRLIALFLICVFAAAQATSALYQAYPRKEAVSLQPSEYLIEAVNYINADAPGRYVVLCDPIFSSVAIGFLGIDYGWAGGVRGVFGMPDWAYPSVAMYWNMTKQPSIRIMQEAMNSFNAIVSYFVVWINHPRFDEIVQQTSQIILVDQVLGDGKLFIFKYPLPIKEELGPTVQVIFDDGNSTQYIETKLSYVYETEINSTLTLSGHVNYNITQYPSHWAFLDLTVNNVSRPFNGASDINSFIYVKELQPTDELKVKWHWNHNYQNVVWKDDSFKEGWRTHDIYRGTIVPTIASDGNILNISYSFKPGPYSYYYYIKAVDVSVAENQSILVRWRSDGPIAVVAYYFESGLGNGVDVVPLGSESDDWTVTIVSLPKNMRVTYIMVGISNLKARNLNEVKTLSIDYVMISTST